MIDFETLGHRNGLALVCQIGACYFDRETGEIGSTYECNIDPVAAEKKGFRLDANTVIWWLQQDPKAIASILRPGIHPFEAFSKFNEFLKDVKYIWCHATFDFVILQESLRHLGIKPTFGFRDGRDIRTLMDIAQKGDATPQAIQRGTPHVAIDDAIFQAQYVTAALKRVKTV